MFNRKYIRTTILALALVVGYLSGTGPLVEEVVRTLVAADTLNQSEE